MSEPAIAKRNITARIEITGIDVPDDLVDKPTPVLFSFDRADYTKPSMIDDMVLEVTGGTCNCGCNQQAGHGTGGCCTCLGVSGQGQ